MEKTLFTSSSAASQTQRQLLSALQRCSRSSRSCSTLCRAVLSDGSPQEALRPPTGAVALARSAVNSERLQVISLISANVEADALIQTFETVAGRSAMIGFLVAFVAELVAPHNQGLFGGFDNVSASRFAASGVLLITISAVLATMSRRKLGLKLHDAVFTTMTAMSNTDSRQCREKSAVAEAVDRVVDSVLSTHFIDRNMLEIDDFI